MYLLCTAFCNLNLTPFSVMCKVANQSLENKIFLGQCVHFSQLQLVIKVEIVLTYKVVKYLISTEKKSITQDERKVDDTPVALSSFNKDTEKGNEKMQNYNMLYFL